MADNTVLNPGVGGDTIVDEDVAGVKIPCSKIYTGAHGVNGGPVTGANPLAVSPPQPATGTNTSVAAAAANTLILAANTARRGATVYNDSTASTLKLLLGTTAASATNFTVLMQPGGYYEVPFGYAGEIRGIWSTAPSGNARITEVTP